MVLRWMALLLSVSSVAAAPAYNRSQLPYRAAWGPYTVVVEAAGTGERAPQRLRILDARGRVLRQIDTQMVTQVTFPRLLGRGVPELLVEAFSGGAHCCFRNYVFTQRGGLRNVLVFDGRNDGIGPVKDLDGDGLPELIAGNDVLAYFGDLPFVDSPHLTMVLGWDGRRYVDRTRRFPEQARRWVRQYQKQIQSTGASAQDSPALRGAALGYYANSLVAGNGPAAWRWLQGRAPAATVRWLTGQRSRLSRTLASAGQKVGVSQARVLKLFGVPPLPPG